MPMNVKKEYGGGDAAPVSCINILHSALKTREFVRISDSREETVCQKKIICKKRKTPAEALFFESRKLYLWNSGCLSD